MSKRIWLVGLVLVIGVIAGMLLVPNPLGAQLLSEAKYRGYLAYTPEEATALAYSRCTPCHGAEKMLQYCDRCGPPFIVVSQSMKKYVELSNIDHRVIRQFSDAEVVAITQVWNALVGNWEGGWRQQDIERLLAGDAALIELLKTPVEQRPIEAALRNKSAPGTHHKGGKNFGLEQPSS